MSTSPQMRLPQLDVLRGVAILLVLGRHIYPSPNAFPVGLRNVLALWEAGGWIGVDLFFVLSGFLVSGLLFREFKRTGAMDIKRFLLRRGLKIYPAFYVFFAASLAWFSLLHQPQPTSAKLGELFFLQNYVGAMWGHTWSLAVEEHFYLLLAIGLLIASARSVSDPFRIIPKAYLCLALIVLALRIVAVATLSPQTHTNHFATHLRIDSLCAGVMVSYFHHFHRDALSRRIDANRWIIWPVSLAVLLPIFVIEDAVHNPYIQTIGFTLIALTFAANLTPFLELREPRNFILAGIWRFVATIGEYSYSIYLWHALLLGVSGMLLTRVIPGFPKPPNPLSQVQACLMLLTYFTLSIGGGIAASKIVEIPILRLRDRWLPSRAAGVAMLPQTVAPSELAPVSFSST